MSQNKLPPGYIPLTAHTMDPSLSNPDYRGPRRNENGGGGRHGHGGGGGGRGGRSGGGPRGGGGGGRGRNNNRRYGGGGNGNGNGNSGGRHRSPQMEGSERAVDGNTFEGEGSDFEE